MEILELIRVFLASSWDILTGVIVPGIGVSFAVFWVGYYLINLSLRLLGFILGVSFGASSGGAGYRSGGRSKAKISKERQNDER